MVGHFGKQKRANSGIRTRQPPCWILNSPVDEAQDVALGVLDPGDFHLAADVNIALEREAGQVVVKERKRHE